MNPALHPLAGLKADLRRLARDQDTAALAERLRGRYLPALGGNQEPAELLFRALSFPPVDLALPRAIGGVTADLVAQQAAALVELAHAMALAVGGTATSSVALRSTSLVEPAYLSNLFRFAAMLPPEPRLFDSLKRFYHEGLPLEALLAHGPDTAQQLQQALIYQQTDDTLEGYWLSLLSPSSGATRGVPGETNYLEAWKALLWIPPLPANREAGRTLDLDRALRGLRALHDAIEMQPDSIAILRYAIVELADSYPRSPEFWSREFRQRLPELPDLLQELLIERWPILADEGRQSVEIPPETETIWGALPEQRKTEILTLAQGGDKEGWDALWTSLVFERVPIAAPPQKAREGLARIRHALERQFPDLSKTDAPNPVLEPEEALDEARPRREERRRPRNTLAAFERVTKVQGEIERLLVQGDLLRAQSFLRDLLAAQEEERTRPELLVKTLSKVAATALDTGYTEWAESLYTEAAAKGVPDPVIDNGLAEVWREQGRLADAEELYRRTGARWPDNVVVHTGLAEVLREQGRLADAEELYRRTAARWPDDVVVHSGLAEVLREQGRLPEAEELYRRTAARWPNNVVAHNGLAEVLREQGRLAEAEELYRQSAARWPNNVVVHNGLAEVLRAQGHVPEAENFYRMALDRWPHDRVVRNGLANLLRMDRKFPEALTLLPEPKELSTMQDEIDLHLRGMILLESAGLRGNATVSEAANLFERGLQLAISSRQRDYFRSALAVCRLRQKNYAAALRTLPDSVGTEPSVEILRLHVEAGSGSEQGARSLRAHLETRAKAFHHTERTSLERVVEAFGLGETMRPKQPDPVELQALISAELEMLFAALLISVQAASLRSRGRGTLPTRFA